MLKSKNIIKDSGPIAVAKSIRKYILDNNLEPGDKLPTHQELLEYFNIGLRRLREGLGILEQEGVIIRKRKGGTVLTEPSVSQLADSVAWHLQHHGCTALNLLEARVAIESEAACYATKRRRSRDLLAMLDTIEQMETLLGDPSALGQVEKLDKAFHLLILKAAYNPAIEIFGQIIDEQFRGEHAVASSDSPKERQRVIDEHRAIVQAIQDGDKEKTLQCLRNHLLAGCDADI